MNHKSTGIGGKGAYASNYVHLDEGQIVYVYVGGKGDTSSADGNVVTGGWNGGGNARAEISNSKNVYLWGSGGGASCITIVNSDEIDSYPQLSSYINNKNAVLVVAGGGGGAGAGTGTIGYDGGAGGKTTGHDGKGSNSSVYGSYVGYGLGGDNNKGKGGTGGAKINRPNYTATKEKDGIKFNGWLQAYPTVNNPIANGAFGTGGGRLNNEQNFYKYNIDGYTYNPVMLKTAVNGAGGGAGWYGGGMGYWGGSSAGGGSSYINVAATASEYQGEMQDYLDGMPNPISTSTANDMYGEEGDGFARITLVKTDTEQ